MMGKGNCYYYDREIFSRFVLNSSVLLFVVFGLLNAAEFSAGQRRDGHVERKLTFPSKLVLKAV